MFYSLSYKTQCITAVCVVNMLQRVTFMFDSRTEDISRAHTMTVNSSCKKSSSGFLMCETAQACSIVIVVCDVPCCPAVWQDEGPQTAAARSMKSLTRADTNASRGRIHSLVIGLPSNTVH